MNDKPEAFLLSPDTALDCQQDGALIVDVRDPADYDQDHIAGAVNIPKMFYHLSTTTDKEIQESSKLFEGLFRNAGITSDTFVILYEDGMASRFGGSFRGWWWLNFFGHSNAAVIDGGYKAWKEAELPVDQIHVTPDPSNFSVQLNPSILARQADVLAAIESEDVVLLDNRDAVEWFCEASSPYDEPGKDFSPRRGRIPGAVWVEWTRLMDESDSPTFKSPEEIREIMAKSDVYPDDDVIIYCFKGSRASNTFAALHYAGFTKLRNYLGSWYEWSVDESLPIEVGTRESIA